MLTDVQIENFQSLKDLKLRLGKFTVVTGATGSGKSAVIRAVRLLAFNARGTGYITRGAKACSVQVSAADEKLTHCAIDRHLTRGKDAYLIRQSVPLPVRDGLGETGARFTKLGGEVPEQVTALLQLSELNFAAQFDRPFLLDSSGGEIARVLGTLTNVTLLFDAAREANRRRLEIMGDLKHAEANLARLTEAAQRFRGMRERHAAVSEAEAALEAAQDRVARLDRLRALTARLEGAEEALERATPLQVPSAERLDDLAARLGRIRQLLRTLDEAVLAEGGAQFAIGEAAKTEQDGYQRLHEALVAAGQCPVCGSAIQRR